MNNLWYIWTVTKWWQHLNALIYNLCYRYLKWRRLYWYVVHFNKANHFCPPPIITQMKHDSKRNVMSSITNFNLQGAARSVKWTIECIWSEKELDLNAINPLDAPYSCAYSAGKPVTNHWKLRIAAINYFHNS